MIFEESLNRKICDVKYSILRELESDLPSLTNHVSTYNTIKKVEGLKQKLFILPKQTINNEFKDIQDGNTVIEK